MSMYAETEFEKFRLQEKTVFDWWALLSQIIWVIYLCMERGIVQTAANLCMHKLQMPMQVVLAMTCNISYPKLVSVRGSILDAWL